MPSRPPLDPSTAVKDWESAFDSALDTYEELRRNGSWVIGRDDFFGILDLGRSELAHTAMLAWLLNPEGRHGLGRRVLDLVLSRHLPDLDTSSMRIRAIELEVQRIETRADLVIWGERNTIVFEVKVDAMEGVRQCDRLFQRFFSDPDPRFIFLTPSGRAPTTASGEAAGVFTALSFGDIRVVIEDALRQSDADELSNSGAAVDVARNYAKTLRREFE